jgi:hypothetical protein
MLEIVWTRLRFTLLTHVVSAAAPPHVPSGIVTQSYWDHLNEPFSFLR